MASFIQHCNGDIAYYKKLKNLDAEPYTTAESAPHVNFLISLRRKNLNYVSEALTGAFLTLLAPWGDMFGSYSWRDTNKPVSRTSAVFDYLVDRGMGRDKSGIHWITYPNAASAYASYVVAYQHLQHRTRTTMLHGTPLHEHTTRCRS